MSLTEMLKSISILTERERCVLSLRYDEHGNKIRTLARIALEIGMSPERIRMNEWRAIRKLRLPLIRRDHPELAEFINYRALGKQPERSA